jgi:hypothetical protein
MRTVRTLSFPPLLRIEGSTIRDFLDKPPSLIRAGSHGDLKPREARGRPLSAATGGHDGNACFSTAQMLHETNQPRPVTVFVQPASLASLARAVARRSSPPMPRLGPIRRLQRQPVSHSAREPFPARLSKLTSQCFCSGVALSSSAGNVPEDPIRCHRTRPFRCGVWNSILPGWSHQSRAPCRSDSRQASFAAALQFGGPPVVIAELLRV